MNGAKWIPCHRRRVFIGSLCDLFDPAWSAEQLSDTLDVMRQCTELEQIICTKRPEMWASRIAKLASCGNEMAEKWFDQEEPPKNLTVLTTVENQEQADARIPALLRIPAARHGISCEPLLGPIQFSGTRKDRCGAPVVFDYLSKLQWVIVGGESGPNASPCNVEWIRDIVRQCAEAGVPCFVKQLGSNVNIKEFKSIGWPCGTYIEGHTPNSLAKARLKHPKGGDTSEWPADLRVQQFPK